MKSGTLSKSGILLRRSSSIKQDALRQSLLDFSIKHLVDLKVVTKNLKTPFNFASSSSVAQRDLKKLMKMAANQVLKRNPHLEQRSLFLNRDFVYSTNNTSLGVGIMIPKYSMSAINSYYARVDRSPEAKALENVKITKSLDRYLRMINHKLEGLGVHEIVKAQVEIVYMYASHVITSNYAGYNAVLTLRPTFSRSSSGHNTFLYLLIWHFEDIVQVLSTISRMSFLTDVQNRYIVTTTQPSPSK